MINIAICDDDKYICCELEELIFEYTKSSEVNFTVDVFYSGEELLNYMKTDHTYDLIFLDIEINSITGIEVATKIRNDFNDHIVKIIFMTSKDGYEPELFSVQPFEFLKKPIDKSKFLNVLSLAEKLLIIDELKFTYKKSFDVIKVNVGEILYFEKEAKKIKIVTFNDVDYFYDTIENLMLKLPSVFVRTHSSYIVNFEKIKYLKKESVMLVTGDEIPLSQRNRAILRKKMVDEKN